MFLKPLRENFSFRYMCKVKASYWF